MGKMSELAAELLELRHCGEILIGIADTLTEMFSGEKETETPVVATTEAPAEVKKEYSFIEVRAALTEKSRSGKTAEVKALLRKHGADKLSEIKPEEYAALVEEAEGL